MVQTGATATPADRAAPGKAARTRVSRSAHAGWIPSGERPDPVSVLESQAQVHSAALAYLGGADTFERAVADFAVRYADQNSADHTTLGAAVAARG